MPSATSDAAPGGPYCNDFHNLVIYRQPSEQALAHVDHIVAHQNAYNVTSIQFTSGTTGLPKAAMLTHHGVMNNANNIADILEFTPKDRLCLTVPFYHSYGNIGGSLVCLSKGVTMILPWPTFDSQRSLQAIEKWGCSTVCGVPTMFMGMIGAAMAQQYDLRSLKKSVIAGSLCPKPLILKKKEILGIDSVFVAYGMTETSPLSFMTRKEDSEEKTVSTVGRILDHTEAKIISPEGLPVPVGEVGEFVVRGYQVMPGYYNDPENTAESIRDGWMFSGDLGRFDEDGFLSIEGRIKDLIIRAGENISPKQIEEGIAELAEVEAVQVIGVPDPKYQEEICALVKLRAGATLGKSDVLEHLKPNLAHFKLPKYVKFVEGFPMTITGKLQKFQMIEDWVRETETLTPDQIKELYTVR